MVASIILSHSETEAAIKVILQKCNALSSSCRKKFNFTEQPTMNKAMKYVSRQKQFNPLPSFTLPTAKETTKSVCWWLSGLRFCDKFFSFNFMYSNVIDVVQRFCSLDCLQLKLISFLLFCPRVHFIVAVVGNDPLLLFCAGEKQVYSVDRSNSDKSFCE